MTSTTTETPAEQTTEAQVGVVLFGLDEARKPRAARFGPDHAALAIKAAGIMSLNVCRLTSPELTEIAQRLPVGRIYANGKGLVPNVRRDLYGKLIEKVGPNTAVTAGTSAGDAKANEVEAQPDASSPSLKVVPNIGQAYPRDWADISIGHLVLASERVDEGWWEAIVIATDGDLLTMRWRDWPGYPKFAQHRSTVALLKPGMP